MNYDLSKISIRAASWLGALCVRKYCIKNAVKDPRITKFYEYIEELASAENLPDWDSRGANLEIAGMGDP